jgi:hypothetical protein
MFGPDPELELGSGFLATFLRTFLESFELGPCWTGAIAGVRTFGDDLGIGDLSLERGIEPRLVLSDASPAPPLSAG